MALKEKSEYQADKEGRFSYLYYTSRQTEIANRRNVLLDLNIIYTALNTAGQILERLLGLTCYKDIQRYMWKVVLKAS